MADTNHAGPVRTEGDGVGYRALGLSMLILAVVTLACYGVVAGLYKFMESRAVANDPARSPLAAPPVRPTIQDGRIVGGPAAVPSLLVREPVNLQKFRDEEEHLLTTYGWVDQNAGVVRLPIETAKELLLERGLPVRAGAPAPVAHEAAGAQAAAPAAPRAGGHK